MAAAGNIAPTVREAAAGSGGEDLQVKTGVIISSKAGSIALSAGDDIDIQAGTLLAAAGAIQLKADAGSNDAFGGTLSALGTLQGHSIAIEGVRGVRRVRSGRRPDRQEHGARRRKWRRPDAHSSGDRPAYDRCGRRRRPGRDRLRWGRRPRHRRRRGLRLGHGERRRTRRRYTLFRRYGRHAGRPRDPDRNERRRYRGRHVLWAGAASSSFPESPICC